MGEQLSFEWKNKKRRNIWWDIELMDMDKLNEQSNAFKQIYKALGINNCKVTHFCCNATQYGGSEGLTPQQLNMITTVTLPLFLQVLLLMMMMVRIITTKKLLL